MRFLLFPFMLAAAMCLAPAQEFPALKWNARDQQSLMKGTWWEANAPLLPPVDAAVAPSASVPEPSANADSPAVDPVPEDFTDVNEYFLPDYIRTSTGLIDPQKLLTEVESNDVIELIKLIKSRYNVNLFVSIFAAGQKVPPSVNAPTIARQIFKNKERNLLLHFHMGDIKSAQIALDPELSAQIGDAGLHDGFVDQVRLYVGIQFIPPHEAGRVRPHVQYQNQEPLGVQRALVVGEAGFVHRQVVHHPEAVGNEGKGLQDVGEIDGKEDGGNAALQFFQQGVQLYAVLLPQGAGVVAYTAVGDGVPAVFLVQVFQGKAAVRAQ